MPTFSSLPSLRCQLNSAPRLTGARLRCPAIAMPINPSQIRCIGASTRISRGGRLDVSCPTRVLRCSQYASPPHSPLHPRLSCAPSSSPVQRRLYSSSPSSAEAPVATERSSDEVSARPEPPDHLDEKERAIFDRLNEALDPVALQVEDISGGCGSMYAVAITAARFKGLPVIKQHRIVNEILGEDIKSWHGIQLRTKAP